MGYRLGTIYVERHRRAKPFRPSTKHQAYGRFYRITHRLPREHYMELKHKEKTYRITDVCNSDRYPVMRAAKLAKSPPGELSRTGKTTTQGGGRREFLSQYFADTATRRDRNSRTVSPFLYLLAISALFRIVYNYIY